MKKISILLLFAMLFNITFSITSFAKAERTETLQLNSFVTSESASAWIGTSSIEITEGENEGETAISFDGTRTGEIIVKNISSGNAEMVLIKSRVFCTAPNNIALYIYGPSRAERTAIAFCLKNYNSTGEYPEYDGFNISDNKWHDLKILMDLKNKKLSYGFDELPFMSVGQSATIPFPTVISGFYFQNNAAAASTLKLQNLDIYKYYTEAMPKAYSAETILNERFDFKNGDTIKSGVNKINITFDTTLQNIGDGIISLEKKSNDGLYQTIPTSVTTNGKTATLICNDGYSLEADGEYRIYINAGIVSNMNVISEDLHEITFFTDGGSVIAQLNKNIEGGIIESFITTYHNDFEDETDFATGAELGTAKGLTAIRLNNADTNAGYLTISPSSRGITAFGLSYGTYINAGDSIRASFDYKAPNLDASPEIQIYGDSEDVLSTGLKLIDYCGGDEFLANEWQTYHVEIYPSANTSAHKIKMYRGKNGNNATETTYTLETTSTTGMRLRFTQRKTGEENYQYFDNIKLEAKKTFIAENFKTAPQYITTSGETAKSGLIKVDGVAVADGVLKGNGSEIAGTELLHAKLANETSDIATEVYFKAKLPSGDKVAAYVGNNVYLLSDDNIFGGDAFLPNIWQKYHIVISGTDAKLWRGEASQYDSAKINNFDGSTVQEFYLKTESNANGEIIEVDDFSWTIYEEGKEPVKTEFPNSVTAKIKNTMSRPYQAYMIYSEYSADNEMTGTKYKLVEVPASDEGSFTIIFDAPNSDSIAKAYAYLWKYGSSVPISEMVVVK